MSLLPDITHPAATNLASSISLMTLPHGGGSDPALFSRDRQAAFLANLAATGNVRSASARVGVSHQTAYRTRLASPGFRRAWDAALLAARGQAEELLACRALEGWEEDVVYHGEVVATRRRFSDRLLLAHLARLDKLCGDAEVAGFADSFDLALERYAAGEDRPARKPEALARDAEKLSSGQWSTRSKALRQAQGERDAVEPCPDCGGRCLGPAKKLTKQDCQWLGNRLQRMEEARPRGVPLPHEIHGDYEMDEVEGYQLAALEDGVEEWWRVIPAPEGADPDVWHFLAQEA